MKLFRTYCIVSQQDSQKIARLHENDKRFVFRPEPTKCFWQNQEGTVFSHFTLLKKADPGPPDLVKENEFILAVEDSSSAENIMGTIQGGMLLEYPEPHLADITFDLYEIPQDFNDGIYKERWYLEKFKKFHNFLFGHLVWQIAKNDRSLLYAIEKYKLSIKLSSFNPHFASPRYGQLFDQSLENYSYHANAAFAINAAFSVIEEIDLDIRSNKEKQRFLNNSLGEWNPKVLSAINEKLSVIGISDDQKIDWVFRGDPTEVEKDLKPVFGTHTEWTDGEMIRDRSLTFAEAIHYASYLRNFIVAHKFNDRTKHISPYDVFNVQDLARRLILTKMQLWKIDD